MTIRDLIADIRLGLRAVFIRPIQRLGAAPGAERFRENFFPEGLLPTSLAERDELALASRCIGCGLCDAVPGAGLRPSILPTAFSKSLVDLRYDLGPSDLERLAKAEKLCPTAVPLVRLDAFLRRRAAGGIGNSSAGTRAGGIGNSSAGTRAGGIGNSSGRGYAETLPSTHAGTRQELAP